MTNLCITELAIQRVSHPEKEVHSKTRLSSRVVGCTTVSAKCGGRGHSAHTPLLQQFGACEHVEKNCSALEQLRSTVGVMNL